MPAAPRRLPTTRSGSGGAATGVRSPANPRRSPANPGPRGFGPHGPHGPGLAGDPILQLAQQQKQQLSDTEMSVTQQLADAFAALMDALMPSLQDFAAAYADELEKQNAEDDDDGSDSEGDDIGGFGTDSPVSGSGGALGGFTRRLPSPANPRIIGPAARRGPHPPGMLPTPTVRGAGPGTVPATWLLARSGGDAPRLLREIQGQVGKFAQNAQPVIAQGVASAQSQGTLNAEALLGALLQPGLAQSDSGLDAEDLLKTTTTAARDDAQFALLQNLMNAGGPLAQLLGSMPEETADQTYRTLLAGLGRGENPQALVSDLQQVLQSSQSRALTISRTEMMGAYRTAQIDAYRANDGVVQGWVWMADLGSACPMCTDLNGEIHPLDDDMVSHPRCRCNPAPITKSWDDILGPLGIDSSGIEETTLDLESGSDWFARQDADTQRSILGPSAFTAYKQGDLKLSDLVGRRDDGSYYQKSLKEAGLDYKDYLPSRATTAQPIVEESTVEGLGSVEEIQAREAGMQQMFDGALESGDAWEKSIQRLSDQLVDNPAFQPIVENYIERQSRFMSEDFMKSMSREDATYHSIYQLLTDYHTYAGGSSSASPIQIALQEAMRSEFGLTSAAASYSAEAAAAALREYGDQMDGLQAFLRQMYDNTQADLAERGITEIQVFRGMSFAEGQLPAGLTLDGSLQSDSFSLQPISSFSTNLNTAMQYANGSDFGANAGDYGAVLAMVIPADQVLSTGFTGFGAFYMSEVTTLGGDYELLMVGAANPSFTLDDLYTALSGGNS